MPRMHPFAIAVLAVPALAACQPGEPQPSTTATPPPAASQAPANVAPAHAVAAAPDDAAVQAFLTTIYGPAARLQGEWTSVAVTPAYRDQEAGADESTTREVCEDKTAVMDGVPVRMLAVCGTPADFSHITPGLNDFFLLRNQGGKAVARAQAHETFGSMGTPGIPTAMQLGPQLWGFGVDHGFTAQGATVTNTTILIPRNAGFANAGFLRSSLDNALAEDCIAGRPCTSPTAYAIDFDIQPDRSAPGPVWPLVVKESGVACGKPADAVHQVPFDARRYTYTVPRILKRESCRDDWED